MGLTYRESLEFDLVVVFIITLAIPLAVLMMRGEKFLPKACAVILLVASIG